MRVLVQPHAVPLHRQRIEQQQPAIQCLADARENLQRLRRLHRADNADKRREYPHDSATDVFLIGILGKQAVITRARVIAHVEDGNLPVETNRGTGNQRFFLRNARAVHGVASGKVVRTIEYHVGEGDTGLQRLTGQPGRQRDDLDFRVDAGKRAPRGFRLVDADAFFAMHNLPLQIGKINLVVIADGQRAHTGGSEVQRHR